jgi:hypothetical protein
MSASSLGGGPPRSSKRLKAAAGNTQRRIIRYFDHLHGRWHVVNLGFERREVVTVHGTRWTCCYKIHANNVGRNILAAPKLQASITFWPIRATKVGSAAGRSRDAKLRSTGWYDACARELRRHGYRGAWRATPWGRMGDFWKDLRNVNAVGVEVRRFDGLSWEL